MERREQALFANDVLLAAVYVDPMYRVILNDEQHSKGKATLLEIALSMKDHEERRLGKNLSQGGNQTNVGESANFSPTSEDEDFEKILDRQAKRRKFAAEATDGSALQRYSAKSGVLSYSFATNTSECGETFLRIAHHSL
ncbi:uncharacterized protein LOC143463498 isoform X2 [Clavelina lepadiformis]|uniref:uncharacterized protein LOC143463498 isoform X2 n=1 Tax=Clavelina lepadiformis TaxID=159417 RepID=UPI004042E5AE